MLYVPHQRSGYTQGLQRLQRLGHHDKTHYDKLVDWSCDVNMWKEIHSEHPIEDVRLEQLSFQTAHVGAKELQAPDKEATILTEHQIPV